MARREARALAVIITGGHDSLSGTELLDGDQRMGGYIAHSVNPSRPSSSSLSYA